MLLRLVCDFELSGGCHYGASLGWHNSRKYPKLSRLRDSLNFQIYGPTALRLAIDNACGEDSDLDLSEQSYACAASRGLAQGRAVAGDPPFFVRPALHRCGPEGKSSRKHPRRGGDRRWAVRATANGRTWLMTQGDLETMVQDATRCRECSAALHRPPQVVESFLAEEPWDSVLDADALGHLRRRSGRHTAT